VAYTAGLDTSNITIIRAARSEIPSGTGSGTTGAGTTGAGTKDGPVTSPGKRISSPGWITSGLPDSDGLAPSKAASGTPACSAMALRLSPGCTMMGIQPPLSRGDHFWFVFVMFPFCALGNTFR
jgi:hypothetical protein